MVLDTLWVKLFDEKGDCRLIRALTTRANVNTRRWYLVPRRKHTIVFTAHKDTVITHGTFESELMQKTSPRVSTKLPKVNNVRLAAGDTLTLVLGGPRGNTKLLELY